jgi:hypothetical protein
MWMTSTSNRAQPTIGRRARWRGAARPAPEARRVPHAIRPDHSHLIAPGLPLPADVGDDMPLLSWLLAGVGVHPESGAQVAVHRVGGAARESRAYNDVHQHAVAELNLILPITKLTYEIVLGDRHYDVDGPASVFVPPGLPHSANVKAGTGFLVEILLGGEDYSGAS